MLKETIRHVVQAQREEIAREPVGIRREAAKTIDLSLPHVLTITGVRRCGKSTLLRQLMTRNDVYCNFEDPNLIDFGVRDFERLEQVFRESHPEFRVCMFDEIQNVAEWERYVRRSRNKFVITGSNASLLSRELGTKLTGRHLSIELQPFSYREMLTFTKRKSGIQSFRDYCREGGFPEYLQYGRTEILQELFRDILVRDIAVRHGVRDVHALQELALYLISNIGKEYSCNNLARVFAFGSGNTVAAYVAHMQESYMLLTIPRFAFSLKRQRRNPRKVYGIDTGFCRANSVAFSEDRGRMLENVVFLALRRGGGEIFYFKERGECDFVVRRRGRVESLIQVCFDLREDNLKREVAGLREAMEATKCGNAAIVTMEQEDDIDGIPVTPAWRWTLEREEAST